MLPTGDEGGVPGREHIPHHFFVGRGLVHVAEVLARGVVGRDLAHEHARLACLGDLMVGILYSLLENVYKI